MDLSLTNSNAMSWNQPNLYPGMGSLNSSGHHGDMDVPTHPAGTRVLSSFLLLRSCVADYTAKYGYKYRWTDSIEFTILFFQLRGSWLNWLILPVLKPNCLFQQSP